MHTWIPACLASNEKLPSQFLICTRALGDIVHVQQPLLVQMKSSPDSDTIIEKARLSIFYMFTYMRATFRFRRSRIACGTA